MLWPQSMVKCFLVANRKNVFSPLSYMNCSVVEYKKR